MINWEELENAGYTRVSLNSGQIVSWRKAFEAGMDVSGANRRCVEVRFGEYRDDPTPRIYLVLQNALMPMPGLKTLSDAEKLRRILERGIRE